MTVDEDVPLYFTDKNWFQYSNYLLNITLFVYSGFVEVFDSHIYNLLLIHEFYLIQKSIGNYVSLEFNMLNFRKLVYLIRYHIIIWPLRHFVFYVSYPPGPPPPIAAHVEQSRGWLVRQPILVWPTGSPPRLTARHIYSSWWRVALNPERLKYYFNWPGLEARWRVAYPPLCCRYHYQITTCMDRTFEQKSIMGKNNTKFGQGL